MKKIIFTSALMASALCFAQPKNLVEMAQSGDVNAQYELSLNLLKENKGAESARWLFMAANGGHAISQYNMGFFLEKGDGISKDETGAAQWYQRAAEQGYAEAQHNLGLMLLNGTGVSKNELDAVKWFHRAAEQGYPAAQYNLGLMLFNGTGVSKNEQDAVQWFQRAAKQGFPLAQYNLGIMFLHGKGVPKNSEQAYFWLLLAGAQDSATHPARDFVERSLSLEQRSKIQAQAAKWKPKSEKPS